MPSVRGVLTAAEVAADGGLDRGDAGAGRGRALDGGRPRRRVEPRRGGDGAAGRRRGRGRGAGLRVVPAHPACRRLVADEGRRRRGRGRQRRDQHERLPGGRDLAPLADPSRPRVRRAVLARRTTRAGLRRGHAAAVRRDRLVPGVARRRTSSGQPRRAASPAPRASTSRCAPAWRSPSSWASRSRRGSWPADGSATRCASTATCSWTRARSRWTGTTRSSAAPSAGRPGRALIDDALGRLRGAGPGHPLRRHQPLGDRRGDVRAGAGAGRARRPAARRAAVRRHAAPA